jgi:kumamolisin
MSSIRVILSGSECKPVGTRVGDQPGDELIEISVILKPKARAVMPHSLGATTTRAEFAAAYGAGAAAIDKVRQFAKEYDLIVIEESVPRRTVRLEGTATNIMRAFEVKLDRYEDQGQQYRLCAGSIKLPTDLAPSVEAVLGLDNRPQAKTHFRVLGDDPTRVRAVAASVSYSPRQVAQLYQFPLDVDGTGETVGIIELGGGYKAADLTSYFKGLGIKAPSVTAVSVDKGTNKPTNANSADGEVQLDIEVIGAIAPGANIVVYFAPNTSAGFQDALTTAIHDTTHNPSVISISWGGPESTWTAQAMTAFDSAAQDAAALGVSICVASGDDGSSDGETDGANHVDFPSSSPHVLACGGTSLHSSANGAITSETVWNDGAQGGAGGGGYSVQFAIPTWQASANIKPPAGTFACGPGLLHARKTPLRYRAGIVTVRS